MSCFKKVVSHSRGVISVDSCLPASASVWSSPRKIGLLSKQAQSHIFALCDRFVFHDKLQGSEEIRLDPMMLARQHTFVVINLVLSVVVSHVRRQDIIHTWGHRILVTVSNLQLQLGHKIDPRGAQWSILFEFFLLTLNMS
jgi:hypothetical protein